MSVRSGPKRFCSLTVMPTSKPAISACLPRPIRRLPPVSDHGRSGSLDWTIPGAIESNVNLAPLLFSSLMLLRVLRTATR